MVLLKLVTVAVAAALATPGVQRYPRVEWRRSHSLGEPWRGALVGGVQLPPFGRHFVTWDPVLHRSPDRPWRRWGNDSIVRTLLEVVDAFAAAHSRTLVIGDLSRPHGGAFGPKHVSHQNGLDIDVYFPRRDGRLRPPNSPRQIDRPLAQELVARFVEAGAVRIFVGPDTGLTGPARIVQVLVGHDNHMHVRFGAGAAAPVRRAAVDGR